MNQNFKHCMEMLLVHEGGFVNGNKIGDPGGLTNMGITKRTYDEFHGTNIDEKGMRANRGGRASDLAAQLLGAVSLPGPARWCRLGCHGRLCEPRDWSGR